MKFRSVEEANSRITTLTEELNDRSETVRERQIEQITGRDFAIALNTEGAQALFNLIRTWHPNAHNALEADVNDINAEFQRLESALDAAIIEVDARLQARGLNSSGNG